MKAAFVKESRKEGRLELHPLLLLGVHLGGIVAVMALLGSSLWASDIAGLFLSTAQEEPALKAYLLKNLMIHAGISTVLWFLLAMVAQGLWRARGRGPRGIRRSRGSIYVEFLAVIPVFLLLTFGLIQLAIINIGGALSQMAGYQAARAVWIWGPEVSVNQLYPGDNITWTDVAERARIAAALVMTPVAPGAYAMGAGGTSAEFQALRRSMLSRFTVAPGAAANLAAGGGAGGQESSLQRSLDDSTLPIRAYQKFTFSYLSTDLAGPGTGLIVEPNAMGVRLKYYQHMAMPIVSHIFGEPRSQGGRTGYYKVWEIEHRMPPQRHGANRHIPGT